jgi:2-keto-4-pentenoate hydratase/2-oxohepta-3-ene-1,7-dioic acid hydratase in catechol pathway
MRIVRFDNWSTGLLLGEDRVLDVSATVQRPEAVDLPAVQCVAPFFAPHSLDWAPMISAWPLVKPALEQLTADALGGNPAAIVRDVHSVSLLPPLPSPTPRVFVMAANFADHAARALSVIRGTSITEEQILTEMRKALPSGFMAIPGTVTGQNGVVIAPPGHRMLDYEVEAAVVLTRRDGEVGYWGYTAWNDLSVRDHYFPGGPPVDAGPLVWALQKNFATGNAAGPWMVVEDDFDPGDLELRTWVNGEQRQEGSTADMIHSFTATVEHLSNYLPLGSGDMITSGTPAGAAVEEGSAGRYLEPGDVVEIQVGSGGVLRTTVGKF